MNDQQINLPLSDLLQIYSLDDLIENLNCYITQKEIQCENYFKQNLPCEPINLQSIKSLMYKQQVEKLEDKLKNVKAVLISQLLDQKRSIIIQIVLPKLLMKNDPQVQDKIISKANELQEEQFYDYLIQISDE